MQLEHGSLGAIRLVSPVIEACANQFLALPDTTTLLPALDKEAPVADTTVPTGFDGVKKTSDRDWFCSWLQSALTSRPESAMRSVALSMLRRAGPGLLKYGFFRNHSVFLYCHCFFESR